MPVTIRGKTETTAKKDVPSGKGDTRSRLSGKSAPIGEGDGESPKTSTDKTARSTDSPKPSSTSARQRARDRRRGRVDVSPEQDSPSPDPAAAAPGRIKNLAGFWSTQNEEAPVVRKKRLEIADRAEKSSEESDSDESVERNGVRRPQDTATSGDLEQPIEIEKGRAKSIVSMLQSRRDDDESSTKKKPFKWDIKTEEPTVFENEPVVLEGVVRGDDRSTKEEIIVRRPGRIKDLAVNFATISSQPKSDDSDDEAAGEKRSTVTAKEEVIERGRIRNVRERWNKRQQKSADGGKDDSDSDSESSDAESNPSNATPQRPARDKIIEQSKIRNLRERWTRHHDGSDEKDERIQARSAPVPLHELVTAKEYGVFENEPIVREDVVRADDEQPDIISCERTQKLRRMWTMMDKKTTKDKDTKTTEVAVVRSKKIEEKQPEPETTKTPQSKFQKGRHGGHKDDGAKTREPESGKSTAAIERLRHSKDQRSDDGQHHKGKLQKAYTMATTGDSSSPKPSAPKSPSLMRFSSRKKVT